MAAARSRFTNNHHRVSSPNDDLFQTANSQTSFDGVMHSTPQRHDFSLKDDAFPDPYEQQSHDSSTDMSIEIGRGVKRGQDHDLSSNAIFSFGNDDSQYEVTGTPPVRRSNALQKQASLRNAKQRAVSERLPARKDNTSKDDTQPSATLRVRTSRFASSQHISATYTEVPYRYAANGALQMGNIQTPHRTAGNNATVQSAAHTSQSFMLPDMPNMTEMIEGNGTPIQRRPAARNRFTSNTSKASSMQHLPIEALAVPNDEKVIYQSIQMLNGKVAQLEAENSEAKKRAEEYEAEITELKSQLHVANRRPDSALGSDDDDSIDARSSRTDVARLQARNKTLQDQLDKAERKTGVVEITKSRVTKERDALMTQVTTAYVANEELAKDNEALRQSHAQLEDELADLRAQVADLSDDNQRLRSKLERSKSSQHSAEQELQEELAAGSRSRNASEGPLHSRKTVETLTSRSLGTKTSQRLDYRDDSFVRDIATAIARETRKCRENAATRTEDSREPRGNAEGSTRPQSRSKSQQRRESRLDESSKLKRRVSTSAEVELNEVNTTTEHDVTRKLRRSSQDKSAVAPDTDVDGDYTILSDLDANAVAELRKKLENDRRSGRLTRKASYQSLQDNDTTRSTTKQSMPRKSSMKDVTTGTPGLNLGVGTIDDFVKAAKTVRVQSPHSSFNEAQPEQQDIDIGNDSVLSNISRRRRRSEGTEGMTSAFIIPDITINATKSFSADFSRTCCIHHDAASCTACHPNEKEITIPKSVPVTDRETDATDATFRPAQFPGEALNTVIKNLRDEVTHLKIQREAYNRQYNQHDPALGRSKRLDLKAKMDSLSALLEYRSDQIYALYDVLEGQKQAGQLDVNVKEIITEQDVESALNSIGIDPAEISGRIARKAPAALDDVSDEDELPWEGLSDIESELGQGR